MYAIAAVDRHWGIGRDNALLFHIPADMRRFRALTEGKTVLMGRKTLQSLPGGRGLPHRRSIVLTGDRSFTAENAEIVHFPVEAVFPDPAERGGSVQDGQYLDYVYRIH